MPNWFIKLRSDNFHDEDRPRSGRTFKADKDTVKAFIGINGRITTHERLNVSNSTDHDP